MRKMTVEQLLSAVSTERFPGVIGETNIILCPVYDDGKTLVPLDNAMCSFDGIMALPIAKLNVQDGKFLAAIDLPPEMLQALA